MGCSGCGGVFYRQAESIEVSTSDADLHVVPFPAPLVGFSWWKTGKRMEFEVPASGLLYSNTILGVRLRDNLALTNQILNSFELAAGSEIESFRIVCDVLEINNSEVTLNCWVDFPFTVPSPPIFTQVVVNTNFHPLEIQVYFQQYESVSTTLKFQNAQFSGFGPSVTLIC